VVGDVLPEVVDVVNAASRFDFIVDGTDFRAGIGVVDGLRMGHLDSYYRECCQLAKMGSISHGTHLRGNCAI
jgi:hypothetical protein